jgi:pilus assembly protein CpaE
MIPAGVAVAVVDADQSVRNRLAMQLGESATTFGSVGELSSRLIGHPVVAVLGPSCAYGPELNAVEELVRTHREVAGILLSDELSTALLQQAFRAGVRDVLGAPIDTAQLIAAVQRVAESLETAAPSGPLAGATLSDGEIGRVMTVFSTKGGAGKSVLAANLAVCLAQKSDKPVVLVDANLQFGDIAVMLKLAPQHTIVDAVSAIDKLDAQLLQSLLSVHESSGLLVLPAPLEPQYADQISAEDVVRIIEILKSFAGHVVIDTHTYLGEVVLGLIENSDDVVLVAGMDIPNIKNVKIGLHALRLLNVPPEKLHLVLNRANSKVKLEVVEVEKTLGIKAESLVPSDVVVPQSVNKGTPVVLAAPKSGVSKAIDEFAARFVTADAKR